MEHYGDIPLASIRRAGSGRSRPGGFRLVLLALAAGSLFGCVREYVGEPIGPVASPEELSEVLEKHREGVEGIMASLTLKVKGRLDGKPFSHRLTGEGVFMASKARARFQKGGLIQALDVLIDGPEVTVHLPWNEKVFRGNVPAYLVGKGRVPEHFDIDPLSLYFPLHEPSPTLTDQGARYFIVESDAGGGFKYRYYHNRRNGLLVKKELLKDEHVLLYFVYDRYKDIEGRAVPLLVRFGAPQSGFVGWLRSGSVRINPPVKQAAFRMRIPKNVEIVEIKTGDGDPGGEGDE